MKTGEITLPLHSGKCPPEVYRRILSLSSAFLEVFLSYKSEEDLLRYLSHPIWFQSLGCFLGFDWHSSGLTTITLSALKESSEKLQLNSLIICGGKKESRNTPQEIKLKGEKIGLPEALLWNLETQSKLVAKIDSALLQDEHKLYLHFIIFTPKGDWVIIQQGKNTIEKTARRYHWGSFSWTGLEKYEGEVITQRKGSPLNWLSEKSQPARRSLLEIVQKPGVILYLFSKKRSLFVKGNLTPLDFKTHPVLKERFSLSRLEKALSQITEANPQTFKDLVLTPGAGEKTWRALALACELISGNKVAFEDPARYSFAHGGKDGFPYPLNPSVMEETAVILEKVAKLAKIPFLEKERRLRYVDRLLLQAQKSTLSNPERVHLS